MTDPAATPQIDPLLGIAEVKRISSLSRSTIERNMKTGLFPQAVQLTPGGRIAWRASDVMAWASNPLGWGGRDPIDF